MSYDLYSKEGISLPYLIDIDKEKWIADGNEKVKYSQKWAVLGTEANAFIEGLTTSYNGLALTSTSREDRGALCIITATYGEAVFTNNQGEQEWWSLSGGKYTKHKTKWVSNNASAIRAFCESCKAQATYQDGVSVSCNPVAGEPKVLCEAQWTEEDAEAGGGDGDTESGGGSGGSGGDEEEESNKETGKAVQFSSTTETLILDHDTLVKKHPKITENQDALKIIPLLESGSVSWQESKGANGIPSKTGWYRVTNNSLALKEGPIVDNENLTPELVGEIKRILDNPPQFIFPVIRATVSNRVESSDNMSIKAMTADLGNVGSKSQSISAGGSTVGAPQLKPLNTTDTMGLQFQTQWLYEGASYDQGSTHTKALNGKLKFVGEVTKSYRTITEVQ